MVQLLIEREEGLSLASSVDRFIPHTVLIFFLLLRTTTELTKCGWTRAGNGGDLVGLLNNVMRSYVETVSVAEEVKALLAR